MDGKQLSGEFSVSFFWPASTAGNLLNHSVVLKRRKKSNNSSGTKPRGSPNAEEGTTLAAHPPTAVPVNTPSPPPSQVLRISGT